MILRRPYTLPAVLLYILLLTTHSAYAADDPFDCRLTADGAQFDLTSLAGEHEASQKRETPPTSTVDLLRFNLCDELKKQESVPEGDQTLAPKSITITSTGPLYPHPSNSTSIHQSLSLTILCSLETYDPVFKSYNGAQAVVEWSAPAGCPIETDNGGGDDNDGGKHDDKPPEDDKSESAGSGIGWFFLV
ncbi:hypothetical protein C0991_005637 [Blastosporella zonata]|nr:hypothetical protein C0991_005637 [Blastosporella zonata]